MSNFNCNTSAGLSANSPKKDLLVMFSGGRTSAYMSQWLINDKKTNEKYNLHFLFCNTGSEHENTLKFVDQCDKAFHMNLVWLEAKVNEKGVGTGYTVVDHETAARNGEPFEQVVMKYGLPNQNFPHCTRELKISPAQKWAKDHLGKNHKVALGIRADETNRVSDDSQKVYPLVHDHPRIKGDVILFWKQQAFDLDVPEHLGNCVWCYKKSHKKLSTLAKYHPEVFDVPKRFEDLYSHVNNYGNEEPRKMFRNQMDTVDILKIAKKGFKEFHESQKFQPSFDFDECAEECGSVWPSSKAS